MSSKDIVWVSSRIGMLIKELLINLYNSILKASPLSRSHAAVVSVWALYHRNALICATVKSAIQCFHFNLLLASYLISQIFLLKSILKVLWYLYGALLLKKIISLVTKLFLLHLLYIYTSSWWPRRESRCTEGLMQSQVTSLGVFHSTQGRTAVFLRNLITSLCPSQQETPNLYLAPVHRADGREDFPATAHKSPLISMQQEFTIYWERPSFYCSWLVDVLYIYQHWISFAVYCSNIWNDLSLSHFTVAHCLLFLPTTASQVRMLDSQTQRGRQSLIITRPG